MKQLTYEQIKEIKDLYSKGKTTQKELAEKFKVTKQTINYHLSDSIKIKSRNREKEKYSKLNRFKRHQKYLKQKEYLKNYMRNKYHTDPEFRKRQIERVKLNYKGKIKRLNDTKIN